MGLLWWNGVAFWYLNDSKCQFYYKVNTCVKPYEKNGVTFIHQNLKHKFFYNEYWKHEHEMKCI